MASAPQAFPTDDAAMQPPTPFAQPDGLSDAPTESNNDSITADEIALYDRQIRLWGMDAQAKLRSARVLLIGMKALGNETAKNLVLAGVGALTIVDDEIVTEDDLGAQFLITREDLGKNRAQAALPQVQKLNPRVNLAVTTQPILLGDPALFSTYSLVIATDMQLSAFSQINAACRLAGRPFYAAGSYGLFGYIFADLISHTYVISRDQSNVPTQAGPETPTRSIVGMATSHGSDGKTTEHVTKQETYTPLLLANTSPLPPLQLSSRRRKFAVSPILACIRALWDYQSLTNRPFPSGSQEDTELFVTLATTKHRELQLPPETLRAEIIRSFLQNLGAELSPVCAFLGGQLAQETINVLSKKEQPIQNMLIFDAEESKGPIYALHTEMPPLVQNGFGLSDPNGMAPVENGASMDVSSASMDTLPGGPQAMPLVTGANTASMNMNPPPMPTNVQQDTGAASSMDQTDLAMPQAPGEAPSSGMGN